MFETHYKSNVAKATPFDPTDPPGCDLISTDVNAAIIELCNKAAVSASPGFTFGKSGTVPPNTWLLCDGLVPSNKTGRAIYLYSATLEAVFFRCENSTSVNLEIYEHDGTTFTLKHTTVISAARAFDDIIAVGVSLTKGKELAIKTTGGSVSNPVVGCQIKGRLTP